MGVSMNWYPDKQKPYYVREEELKMAKSTKKPTQKLRVIVTAKADFELTDLDNLQAWLDDIRGEGSIIDQKIEVIDGDPL